MFSAWPTWATATFGGLSVALLSLHALDASPASPPSLSKTTPADFTAFQRKYLCVYWIVMFADWLQGPNMYTLYQSYGMDVGALFMIGFTSSAVCSSTVGRLVDTYGRKRACVIVINLLEHVPNFTVLAVGRVLGGISTALLFSAFESWMVSEHRRQRFPDELLASTFALAAEGNGLVAIVAGVVAQIAADQYGDIAPFQLAIAATVVAALWIWRFWPSDSPPVGTQERATSESTTTTPSPTTWTWPVLALGLSYSLFEGAMYVFVFLWVPALQSLSPDPLPVGLVFASFMLCLAIGGKVVRGVPHSSLPLVLSILCGVAALCMVIPALEWGLAWTLASFLVFEVCVGMYFPITATLRADNFPDATMSTIMTAFRLPTNVIVLAGTQMASWSATSPHIFLLCAAVHIVAAAVATTGITVVPATK
ncbi:hypothetical protein AaE_003109 [Aphanomyces astaci]|uniref:Molybdate-anion transporter n=1 Tax=Aphanomyces astaci TaxID=112090 RepID=A0A6A5ASH3_APHAT|nr:hypothetical protein AaE_003109 [Aphanomyces astaci]